MQMIREVMRLTLANFLTSGELIEVLSPFFSADGRVHIWWTGQLSVEATVVSSNHYLDPVGGFLGSLIVGALRWCFVRAG